MRLWPRPTSPWIMFQSWQRQLFAHWSVPAALLRPLVPQALTLDLCEGDAFVGITPFEVRGLRFHLLPQLPFASTFPEVNVRTYVTVGGKPGVFFFSLDAASSLAVAGARLSFRLPYHTADMSIVDRGDGVAYCSRRRGADAELQVMYRPIGPPSVAAPGTLEHFLTERYALYVVLDDGRVMRGDIDHEPWRLQPAAAEFERNSMAVASGITLPPSAPLLHYSARQDARIWPLVSATD